MVGSQFLVWYTYGRGAQSMVDCQLSLPHLPASSPLIHLVLLLLNPHPHPQVNQLHLVPSGLELEEGEEI